MFVILFFILWFIASAWSLMIFDRVGTRERKWSWSTLLPAVFLGGLLALVAFSCLLFLCLWVVGYAFPDEVQANGWWDWLFLATGSLITYLMLFGIVEFALKLLLQECRFPLWLAMFVQIPFLSFVLLTMSKRVATGTDVSVEAAVVISGIMVVMGYLTEKWLGFHRL
ncbi:hypothetical protein [Desmospora activa]|uniref:Uncharacterized protein n=1 Tax=Desmospora activa DSM 45169 TaxID=1121389 RepID=A0A2T4Z8X5_9BACL|nr:hypothetical protein [Desmospora activa]PTM58327.1 hypothetical protein C8J48_0908 [Desmospora activa DSM 45169]